MGPVVDFHEVHGIIGSSIGVPRWMGTDGEGFLMWSSGETLVVGETAALDPTEKSWKEVWKQGGSNRKVWKTGSCPVR